MYHTKSTYLLVLMSIVSFSGFATENIEQDNDQLLQTSCQTLAINPEQVNAKSCITFIQGFLAAAQTIAPSPVVNQKSKEDRKFLVL